MRVSVRAEIEVGGWPLGFGFGFGIGFGFGLGLASDIRLGTERLQAR